MAIRMTELMKFNIMTGNISSVQNDYAEIMEKLATMRRINKPSDDPAGVTRTLNLKQSKASVDQYLSNIQSCTSWLTETESKLNSAEDLLTKAREIAVSQSSATASEDNRTTAALNVQEIIEEMLSLVNAKLGDRYLFAGSQMDEKPFRETAQAAEIGTAKASDANAYDGTVVGGGTYTGVTNTTYVVKIAGGGTLADATYQVSTDGGRTWGSVKDDLDSGTITLGNGVALTFSGGTTALAQGDLFSLQAYVPGYYRGNGESQRLAIGQEAIISYGISGEEAFTAGSHGGSDVFAVLNDLKTALAENDPETVRLQIDRLQKAANQLTNAIAKCGTMGNRLDAAQSNLQNLADNITGLISDVEDADVTELATQFASRETALQAAYAVASRIGNTTILDFMN